MKVRLNWALFLLTAASYVFYPVWHIPVSWQAQWALLNFFILISAAALYSPLGEVSLDASLPELKQLWPVMLLAAAVCFPFWLLPLPTGFDDQSHAGPAAWLLGRLTSGLQLDIRLLPALFLPAAALAAAALVKLYRSGLNLPSRRTAALALAAAGNLFFFASLRFNLAEAIGRYETVLRYPPVAKFIYLPAYLLLGVHEAPPRLIQFFFLALAAVYMLRLLKFMKAAPPPRLTYLLIFFFPTFFNLAITAELEAGTVFFFMAAISHFIKAAATGEKEQFLKCAFWTAAGLFYKQLILGLLISFLPALAALWFLYPQRREAWAYGLKTLAIPALTGLPFILLSAALGIRGTALVPANLLDPQLMLLTLRNVYDTAGPGIAALLTLAAAACFYRRRSLGLVLLAYLAGAYYFMISATYAVGLIRHAQPFYIILVFVLAFWAADFSASRPAAKAPIYAVLLSLLFFQAVLARNPYQRKTAFNYSFSTFPYRETAQYFKDLGRTGLRIYAPMEVEPSHFYLAKSGLAGKLDWDRTLPADFSAAKAEKVFREGGFDFLLLPYSPFPGLRTADLEAIAKELEGRGGFCEVKLFDYHGNKLKLFKLCAE